jgi:UDP-N-acetylglucosamine 2-epimerase (non-hydrolysing)
MRYATERPEGIEAGIARLVGTNHKEIAGTTIRLLRDRNEYTQMVASKNPYGDGKAANRIVAALREGVR